MTHWQQPSAKSFALMCLLALVSFGCSSTGDSHHAESVVSVTEPEESVQSLILKLNRIQNQHRYIVSERYGSADLEMSEEDKYQFNSDFDRLLRQMHLDADETLLFLGDFIASHRPIGNVDP